MRRWLPLLTVLVVIGALGQARLPDIGVWLRNSRDYGNVRTGCAIRYNDAIRQLECAPGVTVSTGVVVPLSAGTTTTVTEPLVTLSSAIQCGCNLVVGTSNVCSRGGVWLADTTYVSALAAGSFTLTHARALGGERIFCSIS